ncbi:peptidoglycan bridge formation glycyltransferase FemA/FemB family protein [Bacillus sp. B190/17]|uniref:Lipid II:glycine glycyltransferase n=1 Tax=Bacillus lumedeiriae TaxID=3058829 RepID=A0ABW8I8V8_9BACI
MLTILYKRTFLRFMETFDMNAAIHVKKGDVHLHSCLQTPETEKHSVPHKKSPFILCRMFRTLVIDLRKQEDDIFHDFHKNTRYKINRAIREGLTYDEINHPSDQEIQEFAQFFNKFARAKKILPCLPDKIKSLRDKNAFTITMVKYENKPLCCHGYIFDGQRSIMLYSASLRTGKDSSERNLIGRANRLLHWKSILSFKEKGGTWYDFCGLSLDPNDKEGQGINQFKKGFGGFEADEFKSYRGRTLLGKLVIVYSHLKWKNKPEYIRANQPYRSKTASYE